MVTVKIANTTDSALGLPGGPILSARSTSIVRDWEKKDSSPVVKGWLKAEALVIAEEIEGASVKDEGQGGEPDGLAQTGDVGDNIAKTEAELGEMTNAELSAAIEAKGGEVKSSWNKAELVKQALDLGV